MILEALKVLAIAAVVIIKHTTPVVIGPGTDLCSITADVATVADIPSLQDIINTAPSGAVICIPRGRTFTAASGVSINVSHPNSARVKVCASSGGACNDTGGANPRFTITGSSSGCFSFTDGTSIANGRGGFTIQGMDCYNTASPNNANAFNFGRWSHDITIDGGLSDGFFEPLSLQSRCGVSDGLTSNLKFGLCGGAGHWVEVRNGPSVMPDQNRSFGYGGCVDCNLSVYAHHYTSSGNCCGTNHSTTSHMWDIGSYDTCDALTTSSSNVIIECGQYEINPGNAFPNINGAAFKLWKGTAIEIRDNLFQDGTGMTLGASGISAAGASTHNINAGHEGITGGGVACAGLRIYRNIFRGWGGFLNQIGSDICIYDNTFYWPDTSLVRGVYQDQKPSNAINQSLLISHTLVYNNTIYTTGTGDHYALLYGNDGGVPVAGQSLGTDNQVFNNIVYSTNPNMVNVLSGGGGCGKFGTNGVNIKNNFVYASATPGHTASVLWDTCSADTGNSATFNTNPNLVNPSGEDFHPNGGSIVCTFGTSTKPPTDKDQQAWDGLNIGAFNCV